MSKNSFDLKTLVKEYNGYYMGESGDSMKDVATSIAMKNDREKAGQALTKYALKIPVDQIEAYKPNSSQIREQQMMALFRAYQNGNAHGNSWRKIDERSTTADVMQYVLSSDPRFKYNGPIYVSQDDITAIARVSSASKEIAKQLRNGQQIEGISRWYANNSMSMTQVIQAADTLIGMSNFIKAESGQTNLSLSQLLPPELTETVVKGVMAERVNGIESFADLSKSQRTSFLANIRNVIAKVLGRDDKNHGDISRNN